MQRNLVILGVVLLAIVAGLIKLAAQTSRKPAEMEIVPIDWAREGVQPRLFVSSGAEITTPAALLLPGHVERVLRIKQDQIAWAQKRGANTLMEVKEAVLQGGPCAGIDEAERNRCIVVIDQGIRAAVLDAPYIHEIRIPSEGPSPGNTLASLADDYYRYEYFLVQGTVSRRIAACILRTPQFEELRMSATDSSVEIDKCRVKLLQSPLFMSLGGA